MMKSVVQTWRQLSVIITIIILMVVSSFLPLCLMLSDIITPPCPPMLMLS